MSAPSRRSVLRAGVLGVGAVLMSDRATAATPPAPLSTIPAVRHWTPTGGAATWCTNRIVIGHGSAAGLHRTAHQLAADVRRHSGVAPAIVSGRPRPGDLVLDLAAYDRALGREGYRLTVSDVVTISANAEAGLFYGTRTLLQLLSQSPSLRRGVVRDWPRYEVRGLLVDIGRQHFSYEWLAEHIRVLGWLKLNELHLHFTENLGWRIASDGHPEVVSEEHLTKTQVRRLLALAASHHVTVVPEIDLPGHMGAALRRHPELQLRDALGRVNANNLDYTLPAARRFVFDLIDEYVELFPGPAWHTGGDEYLMTVPLAATPADYAPYPQLEAWAKQRHGEGATAKDGILGLLNEINRRVHGHGKSLRVWNDGLAGGKVVRLDRTVDVEWWTDLGGLRPDDLLARGHRITNMSWQPTYYVNGFPGGFIPGWSNDIPFPNKPREQDVWTGWAPHQFRGPLSYQGLTATPTIEVAVGEPRNRGARLAVWNDDPTIATERQTAINIAPRLRSMAQRTWGTDDLVGRYTDFQRLIAATGGPSTHWSRRC